MADKKKPQSGAVKGAKSPKDDMSKGNSSKSSGGNSNSKDDAKADKKTSSSN